MNDDARTAREARAILESRASELARPRSEKAAEATIELVRFTRGGEAYGLESRFVHEVFQAGRITALPGVPRPVVGATGWRGGILVLVEAGNGGGEAGAGPMVLAVGETRAEIGILADDVAQVERIPVASIGTVGEESLVERAERTELRGITPDGVLVLDGAALIRKHTQRSSR